MTKQNTIILATDDMRLLRKAEHLFARESAATVQFAAEVNAIHDLHSAAIASMAARESEQPQSYIFIDLDAKQFNGYELAQQVRAVLPKANITASSLGIDPTIIQKTKLYGINNVLQRYKFEELLKNIAQTMQGNASTDISTY